MRKSLLLSSLIFFIIIGLYGQNHSQNESDTEYHPSPSNRYIHYPGTFYTQYYGVRYGNTSAMILNSSDTLFYLQDNDAAIGVYLLGQGSTTFPLVPNTYYNPSNIWGNPPSTIYENYVLDAYWAAMQYVYYLRNHFNCPKDYFQRYYSPGIYGSYGICDTTTRIFIADGAFIDHTHWETYDANALSKSRDQEDPCPQNVIVIGSPGTTHNPRASIDEVTPKIWTG